MSQIQTEEDLIPYFEKIAAAKQVQDSQAYITYMAQLLLILPELKDRNERCDTAKTLTNVLEKANWLRSDNDIIKDIVYLQAAAKTLIYPSSDTFLERYQAGVRKLAREDKVEGEQEDEEWLTVQNAIFLIGAVIVIVLLTLLLLRGYDDSSSASSTTSTILIPTSDNIIVVNTLPPARITTPVKVATPTIADIDEPVSVQEDTSPPAPTPLPTGVAGSSVDSAGLPIAFVPNGASISIKRCYYDQVYDAEGFNKQYFSGYLRNIMLHKGELVLSEMQISDSLGEDPSDVQADDSGLIGRILPTEPVFLFGGTMETSSEDQYRVRMGNGLQLLVDTNGMTEAQDWLEANVGRNALMLVDVPVLWGAVRNCRAGTGDCGKIETLLGESSSLEVTLRVLVEPNRDRMQTRIVAQSSEGIEDRYLYGAMGEFGLGQLLDMTHYSQLTEPEKALFTDSPYGMVLVEGFEQPDGEMLRAISTKRYGFLAYDEANQHFRHVEDWAADACTFD